MNDLKDYQRGYRKAGGPLRNMFATGQELRGHEQYDAEQRQRSQGGKGGIVANLVLIAILAVIVGILSLVFGPDTGRFSTENGAPPVSVQLAISLPVVWIVCFLIAGVLLPIFSLARLLRLRERGRIIVLWFQSGLALAVAVSPFIAAALICENAFLNSTDALPGGLTSAGITIAYETIGAVTGQNLFEAQGGPRPGTTTQEIAVMAGLILAAPFIAATMILASAFRRVYRWVAAPLFLAAHIGAILAVLHLVVLATQ